MKLLITGFEPFNNSNINASSLAINLLPDKINNCKLVKKTIPTVFNKSFEVLKKLIDFYEPNILICVGQAGGRAKITIERVAINIDDAPIPDNEGNMPNDKTIKIDGENAYFSTLPIKAITKNIRKYKIPADVSNSAGTFVCNHIMYNSLYYASKNNKKFKAGFIHVPYIPEQVIDSSNIPSMSLETIVKAITIAIETSINFYNKNDISSNLGSIY